MRILYLLLDAVRTTFDLVIELGIAPAASHTVQVSPVGMLWIHAPIK